jgi:hypothetical protein
LDDPLLDIKDIPTLEPWQTDLRVVLNDFIDRINVFEFDG